MIRTQFYLLICLIPFYLGASFIGPLLRGVAKQEIRAVISKTARKSPQLLRHSDEFVRNSIIPTAKKIVKNKSLYRGVSKNIKEFWSERLKHLLDFSTDITTAMLDPNIQIDFKNKSDSYFNEITSNPSYPNIYKKMCEKFHLDTMSYSSQFLVLNGAKWRTYQISKEDLYSIYLTYSTSFAKDELIKLRGFYHCNEEKNQEIDAFAEKMKIILPKSSCPDEEAGWVDVLLGLLFLAMCIYLGYQLLKWLRNLFTQIINFFMK
jgi:hypothetical protein